MAMNQTTPAVIAIALAAAAFTLPASASVKLSTSVMSLAKQCAPSIAPETVGYLVSHESRNHRYAIHVNGAPWSKQPKAETFEQAKAIVEELTEQGASFDTGYGQIWSGNLKGLGVTAVDMLEPCKNLAALERILSDCYRVATTTHEDAQIALRHALSCYNTGDQRSGFANGYVGKILAVAQANNQLKVPALRIDDGESAVESVDKRAKQESASPVRKSRQGGAQGFDAAAPQGFAERTLDGFEAMAQQRDGAPNEGLSHPAKATRGTQNRDENSRDEDTEGRGKEVASAL